MTASRGSRSAVRSAARPLTARKSGARTPSTTVRSGRSSATGTIRPDATMAPQRNAPRVESSPIPSVMTAPRVMKAAATRQEAPTPGSRRAPGRAVTPARRATTVSRASATTAASVNATSPSRDRRRAGGGRSAAMIESPIHTIASSITATLSDSWLRLRCRTPRSAKILTITGTALTDSARPANAAKVHVLASGPRSRGSAASARTTVDTSGRPKRAQG